MGADAGQASPFRIVSVDPGSSAAQLAMAAYFTELDERFPSGFDPGDALASARTQLCAPHGCFFIGRGAVVPDPVACGGLARLDDRSGEIKRMWVHSDARGRGLGRRLLRRLEVEAERIGYRRVVLDTNSTLTEAMALYESAGYRSIDPYNDNPYALRWYEKPLIGTDPVG